MANSASNVTDTSPGGTMCGFTRALSIYSGLNTERVAVLIAFPGITGR